MVLITLTCGCCIEAIQVIVHGDKMSDYLLRRPEGFAFGYTPITGIGEESHDTGMNFGIIKMRGGEERDLTSKLESACLLMDGKVTFRWSGEERTVERTSIFEEEPFALHLPPGCLASVRAETDAELALNQTANVKSFTPMFFDKSNILDSEHRGKGLLDDASYRIVRTIFDIRNRPEAKLVLGEVVNFPGRWSSYPPHHHPQPEIYHYRFTEPQGYGHGELGDEVYKLHQYDTLKIMDMKDHAQCAAPGYGMYYIWAIRHLPGDPYTVPEFTEAHAWAKEDGEQGWQPSVFE